MIVTTFKIFGELHKDHDIISAVASQPEGGGLKSQVGKAFLFT